MLCELAHNEHKASAFLSNRKVLEKNFLYDKNTTCKHVVNICEPRGDESNCFAMPLGREGAVYNKIQKEIWIIVTWQMWVYVEKV